MYVAGRHEKTREAITKALAHADYFGETVAGQRVAGFFSKEIGEDLLDDPGLFVDYLEDVSDLDTFCPAGPGAIQI